MSDRDRAMVFVDGSNFLLTLFTMIDVKLEAEKPPDDALTLASEIIAKGLRNLQSGRHFENQKVIRQYWFASTRGSPEDRNKVATTLRRGGFDPILFPKLRRKKEKGVDLAVAREMLIHAFNRNYETAIIVAGDEDYIGLIEDVKRLGATVVGMFFPVSALAPSLQLTVDRFMPLETLESQQPALVQSVRDAAAKISLQRE